MNRTHGNNRLGAPGINDSTSYTRGMLSMSDEKKNEVPVAGPGNKPFDLGKAIEVGKKVGVVLGIIAASVLSLPAVGITLPAGVIAAANTLLGVLASLGIVSSGLKPTLPAPPHEDLK